MTSTTDSDNIWMTSELKMLTAREQLANDIDAIVDEFTFNLPIDDIHERSELAEDLTRLLCDAVCRNFPSNRSIMERYSRDL